MTGRRRPTAAPPVTYEPAIGRDLRALFGVGPKVVRLTSKDPRMGMAHRLQKLRLVSLRPVTRTLAEVEPTKEGAAAMAATAPVE